MAKTILLPDFMINEGVINSIIKEAEQMIESANIHLSKLQNEGIPTDLATLKVICKNDEAFIEWTKKAEASYIGKLGFLPKEERQRIHNTFEDLIKRTDAHRSCLSGFLFNNRGYEPKQDKDGKLSFDLQKIGAGAELKARKYFSDEDKKYFALLQNLEESFKKLQNFESVHHYTPYSQSTDIYKDLINGFTPEWYVMQNGFRIGKMSKKAIEMLDDEQG